MADEIAASFEKVNSVYKLGQMYRVPWSPNPHRLEAIEPHYCQLHGEFIGHDLHLIKRRNSEKKPWGSCIYIARPSEEITPWTE